MARIHRWVELFVYPRLCLIKTVEMGKSGRSTYIDCWRQAPLMVSICSFSPLRQLSSTPSLEKIYQRQITKMGLSDCKLLRSLGWYTELFHHYSGRCYSSYGQPNEWRREVEVWFILTTRGERSGCLRKVMWTDHSSKLRDLFTVYTRTPCHTHDLLGCRCSVVSAHDSRCDLNTANSDSDSEFETGWMIASHVKAEILGKAVSVLCSL